MTKQVDMLTLDLCANFHGGNAESRMAFEKITPAIGNLQEKVLRFIQDCFDQRDAGVTVKEVRVALAMEHQTASARMTELKRMELIAPTGQRREGCMAFAVTDLGKRTLTVWRRK